MGGNALSGRPLAERKIPILCLRPRSPCEHCRPAQDTQTEREPGDVAPACPTSTRHPRGTVAHIDSDPIQFQQVVTHCQTRWGRALMIPVKRTIGVVLRLTVLTAVWLAVLPALRWLWLKVSEPWTMSE